MNRRCLNATIVDMFQQGALQEIKHRINNQDENYGLTAHEKK